MIGKLIGAGLGAKLGSETRKMGGTTGAVLGAVAVPLVRRLRLPTLLALVGGGYLVKRLADKAEQEPTTPSTTTTKPSTPPA